MILKRRQPAMTPRLIARLMILLVTALLAVPSPASAQKKKKEAPKAAPAAQTETKHKSGGNMRELLRLLEGQQTNLGVLAKITDDYVVFHSEGDTLMYPIDAIQVVKFLKTDEGDPRKIEIRFLSKD
jgi:hypothetical protein